MNFIVEITEDKFSELTENAEKMLRYGGKVMSCLDSIKRERYGERSPMPDYRNQRHESEHDDYPDYRRPRERRDYDY